MYFNVIQTTLPKAVNTASILSEKYSNAVDNLDKKNPQWAGPSPEEISKAKETPTAFERAWAMKNNYIDN